MSPSRKNFWNIGVLMLIAFGVKANAQIEDARERLLQRTIAQLHLEQYDSALAACAQMRQSYPEDPAGYLMAASVYQTMMRLYRVRIFETAFDSLSRHAEELAEKQTRRHSSAEAWFMLGSAKGNLALHRFHQGEWAAALQDVVLALHAMKRAVKCDPSFVDPGMALALYEYWKSKKLGLGLGLFSGNRKNAFALLEKVRAQGRYVALDAAFSLQDLYVHEGDYPRALELNEDLYKNLPKHPSVLYHRAIILENLQRPREALAAWEQLAECLQAFQRPSYGFLAECQLHRARLLASMQDSTADKVAIHQIGSALSLAASYVQQCDTALELEGSIQSFTELKKAISEMSSKYTITNTQFSEAQKP